MAVWQRIANSNGFLPSPVSPFLEEFLFFGWAGSLFATIYSRPGHLRLIWSSGRPHVYEKKMMVDIYACSPTVDENGYLFWAMEHSCWDPHDEWLRSSTYATLAK